MIGDWLNIYLSIYLSNYIDIDIDIDIDLDICTLYGIMMYIHYMHLYIV